MSDMLLNLLRALLLVYVSGMTGYLATVILASLNDRKTPIQTKLIALACAPIWPIIVGIIMKNNRSE